jgi:hypothetical protein
MSVDSILALIESGNKGGEELYFSQRPLARFPHPFLIATGKVSAT